VQALEVQADEGAVLSPIAGIVLRREVELGELVAPNQALFEIADTSELHVELRVDEADIARLVDGADGSVVALAFYALPGRAFSGRISTILPEPDRVRRTYTVKVRLDQPIPGLRVGMTAEANVIVSRHDDALLLPAEAIDGDHAWFAVDGRAVRRPVTLGIRDLTRVEVTSGAGEGDLAIVDAATRGLTSGSRIRTTVRPGP
jgi:RND family efflux transporter MFP subunit